MTMPFKNYTEMSEISHIKFTEEMPDLKNQSIHPYV
jgi:hypothetical protein